MDSNKEITVSISCLVYNHAQFLRRCFEGFLMQETSFGFEVLVHDDASTDGSIEIIREYSERFPTVFKPLFEKENQFSKGVPVGSPVWNFPRSKGKYIAICEGDDYWTDPYKLQKQVDFMEKNPDCSLCFHNAMIHWYDSDRPDERYAEFTTGYFSSQELLEKWICPTASFLFRACFIDEYISLRSEYPSIPFGDIPLVLFYSLHGKIYGFSETMSVYGKNKGGWTNYADAHKIYRDALGWEEMEKAFHKEYKSLLLPGITRRYLYSFKRSMEAKDYQLACKSFYRGILRHPIHGVKSIFVILSRKKGKQTWCR